MSPEYASVLLVCVSSIISQIVCVVDLSKPHLKNTPQGITNTVGAIPGIVGVALTGFLLDSTHSWSVSWQLLHLYIPFISSDFFRIFKIFRLLCVDLIVCPIDLLLLDRDNCLVGLCQQ